MHIAIAPVVKNMLAICKVVSLRMFEYQNAIGFQYIICEN